MPGAPELPSLHLTLPDREGRETPDLSTPEGLKQFKKEFIANAAKGRRIDRLQYFQDLLILDTKGILEQDPKLQAAVVQSGQDPLIWEGVYTGCEESVNVLQNPDASPQQRQIAQQNLQAYFRITKITRMDISPADLDPAVPQIVLQAWQDTRAALDTWGPLAQEATPPAQVAETSAPDSPWELEEQAKTAEQLAEEGWQELREALWQAKLESQKAGKVIDPTKQETVAVGKIVRALNRLETSKAAEFVRVHPERFRNSVMPAFEKMFPERWEGVRHALYDMWIEESSSFLAGYFMQQQSQLPQLREKMDEVSQLPESKYYTDTYKQITKAMQKLHEWLYPPYSAILSFLDQGQQDFEKFRLDIAQRLERISPEHLEESMNTFFEEFPLEIRSRLIKNIISNGTIRHLSSETMKAAYLGGLNTAAQRRELDLAEEQGARIAEGTIPEIPPGTRPAITQLAAPAQPPAPEVRTSRLSMHVACAEFASFQEYFHTATKENERFGVRKDQEADPETDLVRIPGSPGFEAVELVHALEDYFHLPPRTDPGRSSMSYGDLYSVYGEKNGKFIFQGAGPIHRDRVGRQNDSSLKLVFDSRESLEEFVQWMEESPAEALAAITKDIYPVVSERVYTPRRWIGKLIVANVNTGQVEAKTFERPLLDQDAINAIKSGIERHGSFDAVRAFYEKLGRDKSPRVQEDARDMLRRIDLYEQEFLNNPPS